jgi:hypothetical protein
MNKILNSRFQKSALALAAMLSFPAMLNAQQSSLRLTASHEVAAAPVEIAALPSAPEFPAPARWSSSNAEAYVSAAAPIVPFVGAGREPATHRFWDGENRALFALTAGSAAADFYVTHANLASGGRELNPVTRILSGSTAGLAANFAMETGSVVGISYLFHKTGHHKLERLTSVVNIGGSIGAVTYGLAHR